MKRILSFSLVTLLVFALVACGSQSGSDKKEYTFAEFQAALGEKVTMESVTEKMADMIGAVEGVGFFVDGKSFELYQFDDSSKIKDAEDGKFKFTIQSYGTFEMNSVVNGNFVLLYYDADDAVISAFQSIQ